MPENVAFPCLGTVDMTFRSLTVAGAAPDWSYRYDAPVSRFTLCRAPETRGVGEHGGGRGVNWDLRWVGVYPLLR